MTWSLSSILQSKRLNIITSGPEWRGQPTFNLYLQGSPTNYALCNRNSDNENVDQASVRNPTSQGDQASVRNFPIQLDQVSARNSPIQLDQVSARNSPIQLDQVSARNSPIQPDQASARNFSIQPDQASARNSNDGSDTEHFSSGDDQDGNSDYFSRTKSSIVADNASKRNKSTSRKTNTDITQFKQWIHEQNNDTREIETIPPTELNVYVSDFLKNVRMKNGQEYEPSTLKAKQMSIGR